MSEPFKSWAIVAVMGHNEFAGMVSEETIAGAAMLRVDVPATSKYAAFTQYLSSQAIYSLSPCTEETARARAESKKAVPFDSWSVEQQVLEKLRAAGRLVEVKALPSPDDDEDEDFDDDTDDDDDTEDMRF